MDFEAAGTAGTTTKRNSSQKESTCQLKPKTGERLVGRSTFEPFLGASYVALGNTHCRTLDHCDLSIAKHMYIVVVCLSLNKTWFYYTIIIELASGVHASLLHYQIDIFLGFGSRQRT